MAIIRGQTGDVSLIRTYKIGRQSGVISLGPTLPSEKHALTAGRSPCWQAMTTFAECDMILLGVS